MTEKEILHWRKVFRSLELDFPDDIGLIEKKLKGQLWAQHDLKKKRIELDTKKIMAALIYHELFHGELRKFIDAQTSSLIAKGKFSKKEKDELRPALVDIALEEESLAQAMERLFVILWDKVSEKVEKDALSSS
jgi:hypothetical protein